MTKLYTPISADPYAFWLTHVMQIWVAFAFALQAMVTIPTPIFCESPDPCSCTGGGFELYGPICVAAAAARGFNTTNANASKTVPGINVTAAQNEYVSLFDFLGNDTTTVLVSAGVFVAIGATFTLFRLINGLNKATEAQNALEKEKEERRTEAGPMQIAIEDGEGAPFLVAILEGAWVPPDGNGDGSSGYNGRDKEGDDGDDYRKRMLLQRLQEKALAHFTDFFHDLVSASDPDGVCLQAVLIFLDNHGEHCELLASLCDNYGRNTLDMSTPLVKVAIETRLLFCARYKLEQPAVHVSRTCEVVFAEDNRPRFDEYEQLAMASFGSVERTPPSTSIEKEQDEASVRTQLSAENLFVALKFMRSREA